MAHKSSVHSHNEALAEEDQGTGLHISTSCYTTCLGSGRFLTFKQAGPEILMTAIAARPGAVESAKMVESSPPKARKGWLPGLGGTLSFG